MSDDMPEEELPEDLQIDKVRPVLEGFSAEVAKIGLYDPAWSLGVDLLGDEEGNRHHQLTAVFLLGDHAFSRTVQSPESNQTDLEIKKLEAGMLDAEIDEIRNLYRKNED